MTSGVHLTDVEHELARHAKEERIDAHIVAMVVAKGDASLAVVARETSAADADARAAEDRGGSAPSALGADVVSYMFAATAIPSPARSLELQRGIASSVRALLSLPETFAGFAELFVDGYAVLRECDIDGTRYLTSSLLPELSAAAAAPSANKKANAPYTETHRRFYVEVPLALKGEPQLIHKRKLVAQLLGAPITTSKDRAVRVKEEGGTTRQTRSLSQ